MADGSTNRHYTSFDQFIAQNDFSQMNTRNPYSQNSYYPQNNSHFYNQPTLPVSNGIHHNDTANGNSFNAYTLTADATEFVPRASTSSDQNCYQQFYDAPYSVEPSTSAVLPSIANLSLAEPSKRKAKSDTRSSSHNESIANCVDTTVPKASSSTGTIPKQQNGRHRNGPNDKSTPNKRETTGNQQNPQKNPKSGNRRKNNDTFEREGSHYYAPWSKGGADEDGRQYNNSSLKKSTDRSRNHSRSNGDHQTSIAPQSQFRNGSNVRPPTNDKKQQVESKPRPKPTDYQPNRNLKRPERTLEMPVDISQREKQIVEIDAGHLECVICCEKIRGQHSTWNCKNCYSIIHLNCTNKWATRSLTESDHWRCPSCQNMTTGIPSDYYCFCGKEKNPQYNRNDVAHSCGEVCHRKTTCDHPCTLLCHPGACPTCQASVTQVCGCGSTTKTMICSQVESITCEGVCGKMRNCGLHTCGQKCHNGNCDPCDQVLVHECFCGRSQKEVPCTVENLENMKYVCENICERELNCKNHKCQRQCHEDACRECELTPDAVKSCPCGRRPILAGERKSCLDEITLCDAVCNKVLNCGAPSNPHRCISKCHLGPCPPCQKSTAVKCRCGQMDQMVKCKQLTTRADDARCKKKCTKKRSCGKHKCNVECCIDIDHICPLPCPSTLSCGKHKCERTCHPGHCLPCQRMSFHELQCECGAQVIYPPVACGTKKPACDKPCTRRHVCDHAVLHNCHTGPTCPPCMIQTTKWCFGKHEQWRTIPCSQESFSCGMPCKKDLPCGEHKCIKNCHENECVVSGEICKQNCSKPRSICGHKCMAPCHTGDCPETMCKEVVEVVCQCGNRKQNRLCHDFANEFKRIATAQLASSLQVRIHKRFVEIIRPFTLYLIGNFMSFAGHAEW